MSEPFCVWDAVNPTFHPVAIVPDLEFDEVMKDTVEDLVGKVGFRDLLVDEVIVN